MTFRLFNKYIHITITITLIVAITILGYIGYTKYQLIQRQFANVDDNVINIKNVSDITDITDNIHQLSISVDRNSEAIAKIQQNLTISQADDSTLTEIEWLLGLASMHLQFANDKKTASLLMQRAEQKLVGIEDPNFVTLHKDITKKHVEIMSIPTFNLQDITNIIGNLESSIPTLSLLVTTQQPQENSLSKNKLWNKFSDMVKITKHNSNDASDQLVSLLQTTKLTVQHHEQDDYQKCLAEINKLLKQYFQQNEPYFLFEKKLNYLNKVTINPKIPQLYDLIAQINIIKQQQGM